MLFKIENANGAAATFSSLGARVVSLFVPDSKGELVDVVQGFDTEEEYKTKGKSQGAICGRFANRIANARFTIVDKTYILPANDGEHCLHSGNHELRLAEFTGESFGKQVHFTYDSPHLERGFPGNLKVEVTYTLTAENALKIHLQAKTDQVTPVNLTAHPFFNLNGAGNDKILDHWLQIDSQELVEVTSEGIPTGKLIDITDTAFDFRSGAIIGEQMEKGDSQLEIFGGYDHCYVIDNYVVKELKENAVLESKQTGIQMSVLSTYPGLQFFTANNLSIQGKEGKHYGNHSAVCLEPQFFPDSPNHPEFPFTLLEPKQKYDHTIVYKFETKNQ